MLQNDNSMQAEHVGIRTNVCNKLKCLVMQIDF